MGRLSHTVSGDIASFRTPSRVPIESLKFHFLPKQAAGTSSPENPIPIEGWTGLNGRRAGKNLLDTSTRAMADHYELNGIAFDYNSDGTLTVNGSVSQDASASPQYRIAVWEQQVTGNYYICVDAPYTTAYNEVFVYDSTLSERPRKWDGVTASQSAGSNRPLSEVRLIAGHTYSYNIRITRGTEKEYHDDKFYLMLLPSWCTDTTFEPYSGELIPITFPNGETIYGGYYDPIVGEIVAEYYLARAKKSDFGNKSTPSGTGRDYRQTQSIFPKTASGVEWATARQQQKFNRGIIANPWSEASYGENIGIIATQDSMNPPITYMRISEEVYQAMNDDDYAEISYKLREPIHIPIPAEDLQAFLDHNNFWSDANDITEVTYAVTESKDILATRKKAMDFDHAHHKKVKWNQVVRDGNFTGEKVDASKWASSRTDMGQLSISDGVATWTCTGAPSYYYQTGITWSGGSVSSYNYLAIPWNHLILVKCKARCTIPCKVRLFALVGSGAHVWAYNENIEANTWTDIVGFIPNRKEVPTGEDDGFIKRFKPCIIGISNISEVVVGTEFKIKELMAFDLTQMFGLGNEPSTVEEFEHICEINGIDLTTYQPYDAGSDRWLIIP